MGSEDVGLPEDDLVARHVYYLVVGCCILSCVVSLHYWDHSASLPLADDVIKRCNSEIGEIAVQPDEQEEQKGEDEGERGANPVEYHGS